MNNLINKKSLKNTEGIMLDENNNTQYENRNKKLSERKKLYNDKNKQKLSE